jgi:Mut7-C ubiquitin
MNVAVLLSGRLRLDGYGRDKTENSDGTFAMRLKEGSTVREVICDMGVPAREVAMTMINGRKCDVAATVRPNDRVILIPQDVAVLWRAFGRLNLGMESVMDF